MVRRKKIGLLFSIDENWIGGTYYILNLINALKTLPEENQPVIVILSSEIKAFKAAKETGYKFLVYKNPYGYTRNFFEKIVNSSFRFLFHKNIIDKRLKDNDIDYLFPAQDSDSFENISNKIYWMPDFQHNHYPEYFNTEEIEIRQHELQKIAKGKSLLILSSENSKNDFVAFFPKYSCKIKVVPFAVSHPEFNKLSIYKLRNEYKIKTQYFIVPNQFWKHKNQMIVLKAINLLVKENIFYSFVFTGKQSDRRNTDYYKSITEFIEKNQLHDYINILGLIPRDKQLKLMQEAVAIIQPSLFEGWSTVVEDAKALNQHIIVSDIEVHREQIMENCTFFDPNDEFALAEEIKNVWLTKKKHSKIDYSLCIKNYGLKFLDAIS